jgi:tellurite resistance protein TehA-like permease
MAGVAPIAAVSMAVPIDELLIAVGVAAIGLIWVAYSAERKGRHTLPVVLTWAACLLAAIAAIWWTSQ